MIGNILVKMSDGEVLTQEEKGSLLSVFNSFDNLSPFVEGMQNGRSDIYSNDAKTPSVPMRTLSSAWKTSDSFAPVCRIGGDNLTVALGSGKVENTFPLATGQRISFGHGQVYNYNTSEGVFNGNQTLFANSVNLGLASGDLDSSDSVSSVAIFSINNISSSKRNMVISLSATPLYPDGLGSDYPYLIIGFRYARQSDARNFSAFGNAVFTSGAIFQLYGVL